MGAVSAHYCEQTCSITHLQEFVLLFEGQTICPNMCVVEQMTGSIQRPAPV